MKTRSNRLWRSLVLSLSLPAAAAVTAEKQFSLETQDVVAFTGGTNMVRLQRAGYLESILTRAFASARPRFRDLAWEADTVFRQGSVTERWRRDGFGGRDEQFERVGATVVIAQFGLLESMAGKSGLDTFVRAYNDLIDSYERAARCVVLLSPTPFEMARGRAIPDVSKHNEDLALYVEATAEIASRRELVFVDLFRGGTVHRTDQGMHIRDEAQRALAFEIARGLGVRLPSDDDLESLRSAVIEKHRLWYDYWRPANWKLLYGDDSARQFTKGAVPFREEWKRLLPLIERAEARVATIAAGGDDPGHSRPDPEVLHGDPHAKIADELAAFETSDALRVNLFASEKEGLTSPLALRWDTSGRAYVVVTTTYPHVFPGDVPNDKIILLEDTDGDGAADRWIVFADGLNIPTGLELGSGGVYVGQNTELLFLRDHDGDGRADERRSVLAGLGNGDSHQTANSFVWSPGGELYFGQGDGIESRVETPWGSSDLYQAGFYRFRPLRLQLDPLLDDFMGPGNPWGVAFDEWGQIFSVDGAGGVTFLSPGQIPAKHRLKLGTIGKPGGYCGITRVDSTHLPASMRGDFLVGDFKANRVSRFSVRPRGSGFELEWKRPVLRSGHRNFRPVDVRVGPDGAIYVVDWYNPIICHQDDAYRDPARDKAHGRIWRLSAAAPAIEPPDWKRAKLSSVVDGLRSREAWTRYQAKRELTARDPDAVASALSHWIAALDPADDQHERDLYEALGAFETIEVVEPRLIRRLLEANEPSARAYAARVVGRWQDRLRSPLALLSPRVADPHPRVRLEAVLACAAIPSAESMRVAARAVDLPMDRWLDYAFTQAVHHLEPYWLQSFRRGELEFEEATHLAAVLRRTRGKNLQKSLTELADATDVSAQARRAAVAAIIAIGGPNELREYGLDPERFTRSGIYDADAHAEALVEVLRTARERRVRPSEDVSSLLRRLIESPHAGVQAGAISLAGEWRTEAVQREVEAVAKDATSSLSVRRASFLALARMGDRRYLTLLEEFAAPPSSAIVRAAAVEALCLVDVTRAAKSAAMLFAEADASSIDSAELMRAFLSRKHGGSALADALLENKLPRKSSARLLQTFYELGRTDAPLIAALRRLAEVTGDVPSYSERFVSSLVSAAMEKGSASRGVRLSAPCLACHRIGDAGSIIGPELTTLGTTLSPERITEELLWPSRQVKEGYTLVQVLTTEGDVIEGYERRTKASEQSGDLILRELATESLIRVRRDEVELASELGSAMPPGLTAALTREELLDLIRYLSELGRSPLLDDRKENSRARSDD